MSIEPQELVDIADETVSIQLRSTDVFEDLLVQLSFRKILKDPPWIPRSNLLNTPVSPADYRDRHRRRRMIRVRSGLLVVKCPGSM